jgi:hypothetical protein
MQSSTYVTARESGSLRVTTRPLAHPSLLQRSHLDVPNTTTTQVLWGVRLY